MNNSLQTINTSLLSDSQKDIYDYICNNQDKVIHMTVQDLALANYVSPASIIKLSKKLGFKGFSDLKFFIKSKNNNPSDGQLITSFKDINQYKSIFSKLDLKKLELISTWISCSYPIYIYGRNMSSIPSKYMQNILMSLDFPCILLNWMDALESLSKSDQEGSLIILLSEHIHKEYEQIIKNFKKNQARIIWISSSNLPSRLKPYVDIFLYAEEPVGKYTSFPSKISTLFIIQFIIELLIQKRSFLY